MVDALRRMLVTKDYADETRLLRERLMGGTVLREEVIRHWHSYVGATEVTRLFSTGIGQGPGHAHGRGSRRRRLRPCRDRAAGRRG